MIGLIQTSLSENLLATEDNLACCRAGGRHVYSCNMQYRHCSFQGNIGYKPRSKPDRALLVGVLDYPLHLCRSPVDNNTRSNSAIDSVQCPLDNTDYTSGRLRSIATDSPPSVDTTTQPDNCLLDKNIDNNRSCRRAIWKRSRDAGVELELFQ